MLGVGWWVVGDLVQLPQGLRVGCLMILSNFLRGWVLGVGCWVLDAGFWCWVFGVWSWVLAVWCCVLSVG